jgi:hypothetical protein
VKAKKKRLSDLPNTKQENGGPVDPFSFEQNADMHPEPLKNIKMEQVSFGEFKFSKSADSSA